MDTWLVQVLVMSQRDKAMMVQELVLACGTTCDVSGGSSALQVGMDTWLVPVFVMSQVSDPVIR